VKLLLDSHAFLWLADDSPKLSASARARIDDPQSEIYLSAATIWELSIKLSKGKLELQQPLERIVEDGVIEYGIRYLPVSHVHAHYVAVLPHHHGDPFDRMLIAQAHVEGMHLVSADASLAVYGVPVIW
jgi:PIN domain nuclease of toxin-antitoxin system